MRGRLVALLTAAVAALVVASVPLGSAAASGGSPAPYSDAWLAIHHTQFDTPLTAAYEARIGYNVMGGQGAAGSNGSPFGRAVTNVQMSTPTFLGNQNEFQISINPTNHLFAVGASNDGRTSGTGYYTTSDGGHTWAAADMPGIGASCCDPGVAYADDGTVYFINLDTSPAVVHFMKSTNNGGTWTQVSTLAVVDRPNIAIDNSATSPHHGRIYITWSNFAAKNEIQLNFSDNGGQTWSPTVNVSHTGFTGAAYNQSSNPWVASDGTVYVGFQSYSNGTKASAKNQINVSHDGGQTFNATPFVINAGPNLQGGLTLSGDARGYFAVGSSCSTFRHRSFPIIRTDPTNPNTVYVTWAGGNLEGAYTCGSLTGVHSDILFSKSIDGGQTWSAPLKVNDDPPGSDQYYPWMDVAPNGTIWIGWHDRRNDPNDFNHLYYVDHSRNRGASFLKDKRIATVASTPSTFIGDYAGLAAQNDVVLPMWWDARVSASGDPFTAVIVPRV